MVYRFDLGSSHKIGGFTKLKRLYSAVLIVALFGSTAAGFWVTSVRTVTFYPSMDSYGWQYPPKANNGGSNNFQVMSDIQKPGNMRGWVAFNISTLPPDLWIVNAKLRLRVWHKTTADPARRVGDSTGRIYGVYRLLQPWREYDISWANQPNFTETKHAEMAVPTGQGGWDGPLLWMEWDITGIVKDWRSGIPNDGVVVKETQENSPTAYSTQFFTHDDVPNEGYYPRLVVTYVSPQAVEALVAMFVAEGLIITGVWWIRIKRLDEAKVK